MAFDLSKISSGIIERPFRMVLCGIHKVGKSTFASQSPSPLFIPVKGEEGADDIDVPKTPVAKSFDDVMEIIESLYINDHDYKTLVIDSASTLEPLIWKAVCKEHKEKSIERVLKGFGKGYTEALSYWWKLTEGIDALRNEKSMNSILIGHVTVKMFNDPSTEPYDQYVMSLQKGAAAYIYQWADSIMFANSKVYASETESKGRFRGKLTDERKLFTQQRPSHPGGGRGVYGQLPYELDLNWSAFATAVETAKSTTKE